VPEALLAETVPAAALREYLRTGLAGLAPVRVEARRAGAGGDGAAGEPAGDAASPDDAPATGPATAGVSHRLLGIVGHRILQELDYGAPLEAQIASSPHWPALRAADRAAAVRRLTAVADTVRDSILGGSRAGGTEPAPPESGKEGLAPAEQVLREYPFAARFTHDGAEVTVDGQIDLLVFKAGVWHIVDYKFTDEPLDAVLGRYGFQLRVYGEALARGAAADPGSPFAGGRFALRLLLANSAGQVRVADVPVMPPAATASRLVAAARLIRRVTA
jgi:hypothetical protein